ncbi:hypothetical protein MU1_08980 [Paenibacillus glycanilyticus]|uniref:NEAT domain-containing protein n=1 Tax=Paenibacillus glycanilyticus TaxID=126569 RepID=A0ABQ6G6F2_9BACL|nr:hypothetical protein MU1_08980 [Paenibacillus glycanilyticus]
MKGMKWISGIVAAVCIAMLFGQGHSQAAATMEDGTYTGDYLILQADNDSVSMANDYWEKPATVVVKGGKATIRVTINHSFWVTQFKVPGGGGYVDTKVISSNKKADTRLVEFTADITKPIVSKIHVTVADIDYDHDYTIRFAFDMNTIKLVKKAEVAEAEEPSAKPSAKPTEAPAATPKPTLTPTPTPAAAEKPQQTSKPGAASSTPSPSSSPSSVPSSEPSPSASASAGTAASQQPEVTESAEASTPQSGPDSETIGTELAAVTEGADAPALAAGEAKSQSEKSGNWIWWLVTAVVIAGAGGLVIWRRKAR